MSVTERDIEPPVHWPSADELQELTSGARLVMLPDRVDQRPGERTTASFPPLAQALRVNAARAGLTPVLYAPAGAEPVMYSEYTADWVLPVLVTAALAVPGQVAAEVIADHIAGDNTSQGASPTVLYREAVIEDGEVRLREIAGPAREVEQLLRERTVTRQPPPLQPLDDLPRDER